MGRCLPHRVQGGNSQDSAVFRHQCQLIFILETEVLRCLVFCLITSATTESCFPAHVTGPGGHELHMVLAGLWPWLGAADTGWEAALLAEVLLFQERSRRWWEVRAFPTEPRVCLVCTRWIFTVKATPKVRNLVCVTLVPLLALHGPEVQERFRTLTVAIANR